MKRDFLVGALAFALSLPLVQAQYAVYPAATRLAKPAENALFYSLPQNSYRITVEVEETISERGVYSDYAEKLLKLPAIKENSVSYSIRHISIRTLAQPDPTQVYGVQGSELPALQLSPEGILLGVNNAGNCRSDRYSSCGASDRSPSCRPEDRPERGRHPARCEEGERGEAPGSRDQCGNGNPRRIHTALPVADLNIRQKFDTLIRYHQTDSHTVIEKILRPVVDEKSLAEQARKMADRIFKLQAEKAELLSGLQEVAYPAGTMEFMYRQMERNERDYMDCFTGTVRRQRVTHTFEIMPQKGVYEYPFALFSPEHGIEPADSEEPLEEHLVFRLCLQAWAGADAAGFQKANSSKDKPGGFYYRLPRRATARVLYNGKELKSREVFVSQWGESLQLPVRNNYRLRLDGKSGGLMYFGPVQERNSGTK